MTDNRSRSEILEDLREKGRDVRIEEEELQMTRDWVGELLLEGSTRHLSVTEMAHAACISRPTAYKLLRRAQRDAEPWEERWEREAREREQQESEKSRLEWEALSPEEQAEWIKRAPEGRT